MGRIFDTTRRKCDADHHCGVARTGPGRDISWSAGQPADAENGGNGWGTGEPEYCHARAARGAAGNRAGHGPADRGIPPAERRLQEGRGVDERTRHRRGQFSQAEGPGHGHTAENGARGRTVMWLRGPEAFSFSRPRGFTLIEIMFGIGLWAVIAGMAAPQVLVAVDRQKAW